MNYRTSRICMLLFLCKQREVVELPWLDDRRFYFIFQNGNIQVEHYREYFYSSAILAIPCFLRAIGFLTCHISENVSQKIIRVRNHRRCQSPDATLKGEKNYNLSERTRIG